ncbi:MAG: hypothetical protein ACREQV_02925, partial [Candidatus Binatia bacterium]
MTPGASELEFEQEAEDPRTTADFLFSRQKSAGRPKPPRGVKAKIRKRGGIRAYKLAGGGTSVPFVFFIWSRQSCSA